MITENLNIEKNSLIVNEKALNKNNSHSCFVGGMFFQLNELSFSCSVGVVVDDVENEVIAEFYVPLKTKDDVQKLIIPNFNDYAISTARNLINILDLKYCNIFTNDISCVKRNNQSKFPVLKIDNQKNLSDDLKSLAKSIFRERNQKLIDVYFNLDNFFSKKNDKKIYIGSKRWLKKYCYYAINEKLEFLDKEVFTIEQPFFNVELVKKLINNGVANVNFVLSKATLFKFKNIINSNLENKGMKKELTDLLILMENKNIGFELNPEFAINISNFANSKNFNNNFFDSK